MSRAIRGRAPKPTVLATLLAKSTALPVLLMMKTYDINEAAAFLKIDRSTALELAGVGTLPGAKVGRAWVFMEDELVGYLRDVTRKQTDARKAETQAAQVITQARKEPRRPGRRARPLPDLPELGSEVAAAQVGVST